MGNETKRRLALAAAFLVVATAGSRILGLLREVMMAYYYDVGDDLGVFTVANKVPNLVRTLLADTALSAAFIPVFSGLLEKERKREAWHVAFNVTVVGTAVLGFICLLGMLFAPQVAKLVAPGPGYDDPAIAAMTVHIMRIVFPTVVLLGIAGVLMGILNSYNHFAMPAVGPVVWNLIIILVLVVFAGLGIQALAWGVLGGTVVQVLIQVPPVIKRRWQNTDIPESVVNVYRSGGASPELTVDPPEMRSPWRLNLRHPGVKRVGVLLGPVIISLGIINFNSLIGTMVASFISVPAPAIIERAFRLFQLPQGVFAIAIGTVLFPTLSRHVVAGRKTEFRRDISAGIRQIFFITLPFAALFAVLALPTVRLVYEHGAVTGNETALSGIASALTFYCVGMAFVSVNTLLNRGFYSIRQPWLPLVAGIGNLIVNAVLTILLYKPLGVGGITLATSAVSIFNFFALMILLSPRIGGIDAHKVTWSTVRALIALVPLSGAAYETWWLLDRALGRSLWGQIVSVGVAYIAGGIAYCVAAGAMGMSELRDVINVIRRRRNPRETEIVIDTEGAK